MFNVQLLPQEMSSIALFAGDGLLGSTGTDDVAACSTTLGTEVDDVVGHLDDI